MNRIGGLISSEFPPVKLPFGGEAKLFVNELPIGRRVELDALDMFVAEIRNAVSHQCCGNASSAEVWVNQHHTDPRQLLSVSGRRYGADQSLVEKCGEAATWFVAKNSQPIILKLVPTCLLYKFVNEGKIVLEQNADFYFVAEQWISRSVSLHGYLPIVLIEYFRQPIGRLTTPGIDMIPTPTTQDELDRVISTPNENVIHVVRNLPGRFAVLGAGGKMGFHISLMLQRAIESAGRNDRVITVSRFSDPEKRSQFERAGLEVIAADLAEADQVAALPDADNIISLAAIKFGTSGQPGLLQRINITTSQLVTERYRRSRIAMLSTGCVYAFTTPESGGSTEDSPIDPPGEYARSRVDQEHVFIDASKRNNTPVVLIRLNYSIDLRYGVLLDVAQKVLQRKPVDVTMGYANVIWQGDAIAYILQSLSYAATPAVPLNVTGSEVLRIRDLAEEFGNRFGIKPTITGTEDKLAWLNNASKSHAMFGRPEVSLEQMIQWVATWLERGGATLNKPTHFEVRGEGY